jgi:hypothetical protein
MTATVIKFYYKHLDSRYRADMREDIVKIVVSCVVSDECYLIIQKLCRVDTLAKDKDMRYKFKLLRETLPEDYDIPAQFSLNQNSEALQDFIHSHERRRVTFADLADQSHTIGNTRINASEAYPRPTETDQRRIQYNRIDM